MAQGILDMLFSGGVKNPRLRLGGEDTPAGGGALDAVGQRIMAQQPQPYQGGLLGSFGAPSESAQPQPSMPQQGGGIFGRFLGGGRGPSDQTVQWLVNKGYDPAAAQAIANDPATLRRAVIEVGGPQGANEYDQRSQALQQAGIDPNSEAGRRYFLTGNLPEPKEAKEPKAPSIETFYDEKTGQEYKAQWDAQKGWVPVGGQKIPKDGITVTSPDGTTMVIGGSGAGPKLTEGQSKDVVYYTRGSDAATQLDKYETELTDPVQGWGGMVPGVGNFVKTTEYQQAEQAGLNFLASVLRKDSGGAVTPSEVTTYGAIFLPAPGDKAEVIQQKKRARFVALEAIKSGMGPAEAIAEANKVRMDIETGPVPANPGAAPAAPSQAPAGHTKSGVQWRVK